MPKSFHWCCAWIALLGLHAGTCRAGTIFSYDGPITSIAPGNQGTKSVDVSAIFTITGDTLTIALQNFQATPNTAFILTNLEWSIQGADPSLSHLNSWWKTLDNTVKYNGSGVSQGPNPGNVDQNQWDFAQTPGAVIGNGYNAEYAISTVSSSPFNVFSQIDGSNYGIVGPGSTLGSGNLDTMILYRSTDTTASGLQFTLSGLNGISESQITNVLFSFGSASNGTNTGVVFQGATSNQLQSADAVSAPEPASLGLLAIGCAAFGVRSYRRRRSPGRP
jgi:hypothetical protein